MVRHAVAVREPAAGEAPSAKGNRRRAGLVFVLAGVLLIALAAGDALAGTAPGERQKNEPRGSAGDDVLHDGGGDRASRAGRGTDSPPGDGGGGLPRATDGRKDYAGPAPKNTGVADSAHRHETIRRHSLLVYDPPGF